MIAVIEPHADDAFLSLGAHIEEWVKTGEDVQIITVYSATPKRDKDAASYAKAVGAMWLGLELTEAGGGLNCTPAEIRHDFFDFMRKGYDRIILPLAFAHPEHKAVRNNFTARYARVPFHAALEFYLDSPYQIAQKNNALVTRALLGMTVVSYKKPSIRKWKHMPLFKTQQLFFHYNPKEKLQQCFELIVRMP